MTILVLILVLISAESTTGGPIKFATLGRPVKRPMLMAARGQSQILILDADAADMG